jgi:hypothetical protein
MDGLRMHNAIENAISLACQLDINQMKGKLMTQITVQEKLKRAAGVICKQGLVQFPLSDTAIAIVAAVVGDNEEEFDLIYAFRENPSQTMDQLIESSGFAMEKVEQLATSLAGKGESWSTGCCRS